MIWNFIIHSYKEVTIFRHLTLLNAMRKNNRCQATQHVSQQTVLSMLQAPSTLGIHPGEQVAYTNSQGYTQQLRVIKVNRDTVILETENGNIEVAKNKVKSNAPSVLLDQIPLANWTITSFDPASRLVCIEITTPSGTRHVSVLLPAISN
jgi:hypothetical protein